MSKHGKVYWLTGLAGSGKTTIGRALYAALKKRKPNVAFLDGDELRAIFPFRTGHSPRERKKLAFCYSNLCRLLSAQGMDVVCCTISLFREVHEYNRKNIRNYHEIFIKCDMDELVRRDKKGIYSKALKGKIKNVIGVNLRYDMPENCDLTVCNTRGGALRAKAAEILGLKKKEGKI